MTMPIPRKPTPNERKQESIWRDRLGELMTALRQTKLDGARGRIAIAVQFVEAVTLPAGWASWEDLSAAIKAHPRNAGQFVEKVRP